MSGKSKKAEPARKKEVNLYVWACCHDGRIFPVGRLLSRQAAGKVEGFFRYDRAYLNNPAAWPVDPVHLPLANGVFTVNRPEQGIPSAIEDSLPDVWGRNILIKKTGLYKSQYIPAELLEALGGMGIGAYLFSPEPDVPALLDTSLEFRQLKQAMVEAGHIEAPVSDNPPDLKRLFPSGISVGGARPKVLVKYRGDHYIAKFPSINDSDAEINIRLEFLGNKYAGRAGLDVPDVILEHAGGKPVLLVKRFDISPRGGRYAIISFQSLLGVDDYPDFVNYSDMAEILRRVSHAPQKDIKRLFTQMLINLFLVNTDDHLKNFSMLHTEKGWELSPAYDIVPNLWRDEQILLINGRHKDITYEDIEAEGRAFGLSAGVIASLHDETMEAIAAVTEEILSGPGLPETDALAGAIKRRGIIAANPRRRMDTAYKTTAAKDTG